MMRHALLTALLALLAALTRHTSSAQGGYYPGASIKGTKGGGYYPSPYPYPSPSPIYPTPPVSLPFIARGTLTIMQQNPGWYGGSSNDYYQQQQVIPPFGSSMGTSANI